jgi:hypothetical protein
VTSYSGQALGLRRRRRSVAQEIAGSLLERRWRNGRTAVLRSARAIKDTIRTALPPSLPDSFPKKPAYLDAHFGEEITPPVWAAHCLLAGYDKTIPVSDSPDTDACRLAASDTHLARDWLPPHLREEHSDPFEGRLVYVEKSYLEGEQETLGRAALIHVLADCWETGKLLPGILMRDFIGLFTEKCEFEDRKVIFKSRSQNWRRTTKPRAIAAFYERKRAQGETHKGAIWLARIAFGTKNRPLALSTITAALAADKQQNPELYTPKKKKRSGGNPA